MTTRSNIVAMALALWLALILGSLASYLCPSPPANASDGAALDQYTHAIWFLIFMVASLTLGGAWFINRQPLMRRVEERLCQFGTGIANLTIAVYFVMLPVYMILEFLQPSSRD